jgi:hypothetical protein
LKSLRSHIILDFQPLLINACSTSAVPPEESDVDSSASVTPFAIANEATTFCKQLYIAACNRVFSNPASLTAADQRCINTVWDLADAATNATRRAAKRTADSLHSDLPQVPRHQRTRLSTSNIYDVRSQDN